MISRKKKCLDIGSTVQWHEVCPGWEGENNNGCCKLKKSQKKSQKKYELNEKTGISIIVILILIALIVFGLPVLDPKIGTWAPWKFIPGAKRPI